MAYPPRGAITVTPEIQKFHAYDIKYKRRLHHPRRSGILASPHFLFHHAARSNLFFASFVLDSRLVWSRGRAIAGRRRRGSRFRSLHCLSSSGELHYRARYKGNTRRKSRNEGTLKRRAAPALPSDRAISLSLSGLLGLEKIITNEGETRPPSSKEHIREGISTVLIRKDTGAS